MILAVDFLLAGQGRICVISNISSCIWINVLSQVERSVWKLKEKYTWISKVDPDG